MTLTELQKKKIEEEEKYRAQIRNKYSTASELKTTKNRVVAALLAIFLGTFGIHKFYLGRPVQGVIYLLFFWTFLPGLIGFFEGIIYLLMSDKSFEAKYS